MSIITELKRRKVFQVAAVYAVMAWLTIQIIDVVSEPLSLPGWLDTVVIVLLAVGFPIAVIVAWAFDLTPEGIKTASGEEVTAAPPVTGQRITYLSQALVVLAVGFLVFDQYFFDRGPSNTTPTATSDTAQPGTTENTAVRRHTHNIGYTQVMGAGAGLTTEVAVSPDGSRFVYSANVDDTRIQLYMRELDQLDARPIPGTEGGRKPFFSPDGEWVGFDTDTGSTLKKVSIRGGSPQTIVDEGMNLTRGIYWGADGMIILATTRGGGNSSGYLAKVPGNGGMLEVLLESDDGVSYTWPQALPDGDSVLFTISEVNQASGGSIALLSLETGEFRTLIPGAYNARYSPSGHIVFLRDETLWAVPFDIGRREITGAESVVMEGLQLNSRIGDAVYSFSDDGLMVYARGEDAAIGAGIQRTLMWVTREGEASPADFEPGGYFHPRLAPNGERLAVSYSESSGAVINNDIWVLDIVRGTSSRLTFDPANDQRPIWTPDGESIVYWSGRAEPGLFRRAANGTGQAERLTRGIHRPNAFSPNGELLIYSENNSQQGTSWDLRLLTLANTEETQTLIATEFFEGNSAISPDARWIAYSSGETGRAEVYVRPFPNVDDGKWQISKNGGSQPRWNADGTELFFINTPQGAANEVLRVGLQAGQEFSAGEPEVLFTGAYQGNPSPVWDFSSEGDRFLMTLPGAQAATEPDQTYIAYIDNWFEELKRLAPADGE